jgi:hypothetical protein
MITRKQFSQSILALVGFGASVKPAQAAGEIHGRFEPNWSGSMTQKLLPDGRCRLSIMAGGKDGNIIGWVAQPPRLQVTRVGSSGASPTCIIINPDGMVCAPNILRYPGTDGSWTSAINIECEFDLV